MADHPTKRPLATVRRVDTTKAETATDPLVKVRELRGALVELHPAHNEVRRVGQLLLVAMADVILAPKKTSKGGS